MATIKEHIQRAHEQVKDKSPQERREYFWEYYKWPALAVLVAIALLISGIVGIVNRRETAFSAMLLNAKLGIEDDAFLDGFYARAGIDSSTHTAALYTGLSMIEDRQQHNTDAFQRIVAGISVQDTDVITGLEFGFQMCAYSTAGVFKDLRDFYDADTLAALSDRLYYVDGAVIDLLKVPVGTQVEPSVLTYPDPHKPELMDDPIPVGINISDCEGFRNAYYLTEGKIYIGIVANAPRAELAGILIDYILE